MRESEVEAVDLEIRKKLNGAFVEDIIEVAKERLEVYQATKFSCKENVEAIEYLSKALEILDKRTKKREFRGVEGRHVI